MSKRGVLECIPGRNWWVRTSVNTCSAVSFWGAQWSRSPEHKHSHYGSQHALLLVRIPLHSLHRSCLQIPPPNLSTVTQIPDPDQTVLRPAGHPLSLRVDADGPHPRVRGMTVLH